MLIGLIFSLLVFVDECSGHFVQLYFMEIFSPFTRTSGIFCVNLRLAPASNSICRPPCRSPRFSCARTPTWTNCASNWFRKCEWSRLESKNRKTPVNIDVNITLTFYLQLEWNFILAQLLLPHLADQAVVRAGPRISRWYFFLAAEIQFHFLLCTAV